MSKKEKFIEDVENVIEQLSDEGREYFENFKASKKESTGGITEKGLSILKCMQRENTRFNNSFKSKDIGDILFMSGRSISGSMRKLVEDGYVNKISKNPVLYELTELGMKYNIDN